jgi:hypothetical protein
MDHSLALGLYRTTFGATKLEADPEAGPGHVHGVWVYDRDGSEVVGSFGGVLNGNVMTFTWQEPAGAGLAGRGYVVFATDGTSFSGQWWTHDRSRNGEWSGDRAYRVDSAGAGDDGPDPNRYDDSTADGEYDDSFDDAAPDPNDDSGWDQQGDDDADLI